MPDLLLCVIEAVRGFVRQIRPTGAYAHEMIEAVDIDSTVIRGG